jgi:CRP-like cAMP-binding protein
MLERLQHGFHAARPDPRDTLAGTRLASAFLAGEELEALGAETLSVRAAAAHTPLVREGDAADQLHVLLEGWACRYKTTREGSRQIVALLVPGDVMNLDSLMFVRPDYGVRVLTPAKIAALSCDRVLALAERHAGIHKTLIWLAMVENAALSQWALCLGRQSALQRVAHLFCELDVRLAARRREPGSFDMPLTQEQLADAVGLTPVHVNRTMQQLRSQGLIATANRTVTLPDIQRLRTAAEFEPDYLHADAGGTGWRGTRPGAGWGASASPLALY